MICHSERCRHLRFMEVEHESGPAGSRLWVVPNQSISWSELDGIVYFRGSLLDDTEFVMPSERWTFRVWASDGSMLLERAATVTYRRAEINGPGCGFCTSAGVSD